MAVLILKGECFNTKGECFNTKDFIDNYAVRIPQEVCYEDTLNPHNSSGGGDTALLSARLCPCALPTTIIPQNSY